MKVTNRFWARLSKVFVCLVSILMLTACSSDGLRVWMNEHIVISAIVGLALAALVIFGIIYLIGLIISSVGFVFFWVAFFFLPFSFDD